MITRRNFLRSAALAVAIAAALPGCTQPSDDPMQRIDLERLDALALAVSGYRPEDMAAPDAEDVLRRRLAAVIAAQGGEGDQLEAPLQAAIASDYRDGRVRGIGGWQVSEVEADLLAMSWWLHQRAGTTPMAIPATPANATEGFIAEVKAWGPDRSCVGDGFNVQSDGHSSLWISLTGEVPAGLLVLMDGQAVLTTHVGTLVTTRVDPPDLAKLFGKEGPVSVELYHAGMRRRQKVGDFMVTAGGEYATAADGTASKVFRVSSNWGPRSTARGTPFNSADGKSSALWINTSCAPPGTQVLFGEKVLQTTVAAAMVTASMRDDSLLQRPGKVPISLRDSASGETVRVGEFEILP
jgi:hypothetical protein